MDDSQLIDEQFENENPDSDDQNESTKISQNIITFTQLYSIETIKNKLENKTLDIPDFQRKPNLWSHKNKSLFIESILLGLPIPSIVVFSDGSGRLKVIDGLQRISTLKAFLNEEFELSGLEQESTEKLNGEKFIGLNEFLRNKILNSTLSVITVQCMPDDERANATYYEIFRRLNQGGLILTPQEIRNATYKGTFLTMLRGDDTKNELGVRDNEIWKKLYTLRGNLKHNSDRERDVELLLRIFAVADTKGEIKKNLGDFLNDYLDEANKKTLEEINIMKQAFEKTMVYAEGNNLISLFKENKIRQLMWYNMLFSTIMKYYLENSEGTLQNKNFKEIIEKKHDLPDSSSDTWNTSKIKKWEEIFSKFLFGDSGL